MEISDILQNLERSASEIPRTALQEAVAHREEITPHLLRILDDVIADPRAAAADQDYMAHVYAMYLLAQFRETRAYPLLVRLYSIPGETVFDISGDVVTQDLGNILASVCGGDIDGMAALVENNEANQYVRSAALHGLVTLVASDQRTRVEVMDYFASLFRRLDRTPSDVWDSLAWCCSDLCPVELQDDLRRAYEDSLVDAQVIGWADIEASLEVGKNAAVEKLKRLSYHLIDDAAKAVSWWSGFSGLSRRGKENGSVAISPPAPSRSPELPTRSGFQEPIQRPQPKVGRNDPCPCGSGKKYKKCCGA